MSKGNMPSQMEEKLGSQNPGDPSWEPSQRSRGSGSPWGQTSQVGQQTRIGSGIQSIKPNLESVSKLGPVSGKSVRKPVAAQAKDVTARV